MKGKLECKAHVLDKMVDIAEKIEDYGLGNLAEIINKCIQGIISNNTIGIPLKLKKVCNLLDKKGIFDIAEDIDDLLPDILSLGEHKSKKSIKYGMPADKMYKMAKKLYNLYLEGNVDEDSAEFHKAKELMEILKSGFIVQTPNKNISKNFKNWWDFFEKGE